MRGILAHWLSRSLAAVGLVAILALAAQLDARRSEAAIITEFVIPTANSGPEGIATGPDGNLWFTEANQNKIGQLVRASVPPPPAMRLFVPIVFNRAR